MLRLEKKFVVYFSIIIIVILSISIEMVIESASPYLEKEIRYNIQSKNSIDEIKVSDIMTPLKKQQKKLFMITIILIILMTLLFYHFAKEVVSPLQKIIQESKKILNGDLTISISLSTTDEIKDVGETINELTANMQEIVIQVKNWIGNIEELNEKLKKELYTNEYILKDKELNKNLTKLLKEYKDNTELLKDFLKLFKVYKLPENFLGEE